MRSAAVFCILHLNGNYTELSVEVDGKEQIMGNKLKILTKMNFYWKKESLLKKYHKIVNN